MNSDVSLRTLFSFIWKSIRPYRFGMFFLLLSSFTMAIDAGFWPYFIRLVIDQLVAHESTKESVWEGLKWILLYGTFLWILIETGFRIQGFLLAWLSPKIEADIRMRIFDHVQHHSPQYFNERFAGNLANKVTDITTQIPIIFQQLFCTFIPISAAFIISCFFMWHIHAVIAFALFLGIVIHLSICFAFTKKCDQLENIHSEIRSSLLGKIVDSLTNNLSVNLFFRFRHEYLLVKTLQDQETKANSQAKKYIEIMRLFFGLFIFLISGLTINGIMIFLWTQNKVTTGEVVQIFNTSGLMIMYMWFFSSAVPLFYQAVGISKQALNILNDPSDLADSHTAKTLHVTKGEILFEKVNFHYGEKHLFQNKDVHIREGEKVGLVGYSGAGKSTFVHLIMRMYCLTSGKILIDGQDIAQHSLQSLRSQIALIPQDPLLFHRSIADNIRYGKLDASLDEIITAAQYAHCHEFIQKLEYGYDTEVGERGSKLSGGERQRIAIARAILSNAPILILDEATSALDVVTEKYIHESVQQLMKHRTSIVIAHRLSTLTEMDRILVFDQGKIIERGSHHELLKREGHYAHMWKTQTQGFLPEKPI